MKRKVVLVCLLAECEPTSTYLPQKHLIGYIFRNRGSISLHKWMCMCAHKIINLIHMYTTGGQYVNEKNSHVHVLVVPRCCSLMPIVHFLE